MVTRIGEYRATGAISTVGVKESFVGRGDDDGSSTTAAAAATAAVVVVVVVEVEVERLGRRRSRWPRKRRRSAPCGVSVSPAIYHV